MTQMSLSLRRCPTTKYQQDMLTILAEVSTHLHPLQVQFMAHQRWKQEL